MKKWLFFGIVALTGCLWADRTANRDWVEKNFAPSNLVGRVETLEGASESDPVFTTWRGGYSISAGGGASGAPNAVVIGYDAKGSPNTVALGRNAAASANGSVQLSVGTNSTENTLQFRNYQLLDSSGNIPAERLAAVSAIESDPSFFAWSYAEQVIAGDGARSSSLGVALGKGTIAGTSGVAVGVQACAGGNYSVSIGEEAETTSNGAIAIGGGATASAQGAVQIGTGTNSGTSSLQFKQFQLLDAAGQIPAERMSNALSGYLPLYVPATTTSAMGYTYSIDKGIEIYDPDASTSRGVSNALWMTRSVNGGTGGSIPRVRYETPVAAFGKGYFYNDYIGANIDGIYFGAGWASRFEFATKRLTFDNEEHWIAFPTNCSGTLALTSDINATNVLAAVQAMTDEQKAELKTALGL